MKFKLVMTLLFATILSVFSQTDPEDAKSQTQDTTLLELLESLQSNPTFQQEVSNFAEGFFSELGLAPKAILNTPLPSFFLKTLKGKKLSSESLLGKVTFIHIWYPECEDCLQELSDLNDLKKSFQKQDVVFLSLPIAEVQTLKRYLKQHPLNFQHIPEAFSLIKELSYSPQNILVDKQGIIRYITTNPFENLLETQPTDWQLVQDQIQSLLIE